MKNKLFYFLSFDGTRQRQARPGFYTVPTARSRGRQFQRVPTLIYDPNYRQPPMARAVRRLPANIIPANRIDSDRAEDCRATTRRRTRVDQRTFANNYFASGGPILSRNYFDAKVNYTASDKQAIWGKYGRMWATSGGTAVFGIAGGPGLPGADPGLGDTLIQVATIGHTRTFRPHLLLDGVLGYERQGQHLVTATISARTTDSSSGSRTRTVPIPLQSGFPNISITGYTGFGVPNWMPLRPHRRELHAQRQPHLDQGRARTSLRLRPGAASPESLAAGDRQLRPARRPRLQRPGDRAEAAARPPTSTTPTRPSCWDFPTTPRRACRTFCRPAANGSSAGTRAIAGR